MTFLESLHDAVERLRAFEELDVDAAALPASASTLSDESVRDALTEVAALSHRVDTLQSVLAGVAASARAGTGATRAWCRRAVTAAQWSSCAILVA